MWGAAELALTFCIPVNDCAPGLVSRFSAHDRFGREPSIFFKDSQRASGEGRARQY